MAFMCPSQGCKVKEGMCIHETVMIVLLVIVIILIAVKIIL